MSNFTANTVVEFTAAQLSECGGACSPVPNVTITANAGSLSSPRGIIFDSGGNLWVAGTTTTLVEYTTASWPWGAAWCPV